MTHKQIGGLIAALGGVLMLAALILGFTKVTIDGTNCGTAIGGDNQEAWVDDLTNSFSGITTNARGACSSKVDDRQAIVWTLGGVGVAVAVVGLVITGMKPESSESESA